MIQKVIVYSLLLSSLVFGDYYSSIDTTLSDTKTLKFEDGLTLSLEEDSLKISSEYDLNYLIEGNEPIEYENVLLSDKEKIEISYRAYNFSYILKNDITERKFILKIPDGMLLVEVEEKLTNIKSSLYDEKKEVIEYEYIVKKSFDNEGKEVDTKEDEILRKYISDKGGLLAIELLDKGVKKIIKVENEKLQQFMNEKSSRIVSVNNFDFKKEKLYLSYVSKTSSSSKRLNITYAMSKKNIKTVLKSPISLFDPESKSSSIEQNVGILRNIKNKELYELKKVQLIDDKTDVSWLNHPKKKVVIVEYVTDGKKDKKVLSKSKGQQFYGLEGLFYLVRWMDANNQKEKVFTFINGSLPFDATMKQTKPHFYEMQKSGQTIFSFNIDENGFVSKMQYPDYDLILNLESIENDTTLQNKQYLENLKSKNNIKLIKE